MDSSYVLISSSTKELLRRKNVLVSVLPGVATELLQPGDAYHFKLFKVKI